MCRDTDEKSIKIALVIFIVLIFVAVIVLVGLVMAELFKKRDISGTPFESRYVLDESGNFIANIPFERYLYTPEYPSDEKIFDIRDYGASTAADFIGTCLSTDCT